MFQPAEKKKKYLKILVYGSSGNGKTHLALTFPRCAVIDTESGTDFFVGRSGIEPFDVLGLRSYKDAVDAIEYLETKGQGKYDTLVIDSITRIYANLKVSGQKVAEDRAIKHHRSVDEAGLAKRDWGILKNKYETLMDKLYNLPFHSVITCWLKDVYENDKKVSVTYDTDKSTEYQGDIILRMEVDDQGKFWGIVEKDRTGTFPKMSKIENPSFKHFEKILEKYSDGARSVLPSADKAIQKDSEYFYFQEAQNQPIAPAVPLAKPKVTKKQTSSFTDEEKAKINEYREAAGMTTEEANKLYKECKGNKEEFMLTLKSTAELRKDQPLAKPKPAAPPVEKVEEKPQPEPAKPTEIKPKKPFAFTKAQSKVVKNLNTHLGYSREEMTALWNDCDGNAGEFISRLQDFYHETKKAA